jgi:xanthosine utilization system XapX-like protein
MVALTLFYPSPKLVSILGLMGIGMGLESYIGFDQVSHVA